MTTSIDKHKAILDALEIDESNSGACTGPDGWIAKPGGPKIASTDPTTGETIASVVQAGADDYEHVMAHAEEAFQTWRMIPAPARGEVVRDLGEALRELKEPLGDLISLEMGKIRAEGHGEVQEMIDICDFAVGLSRQLYGLTMHSERSRHRMYEQWHPRGVVGVITAFNFPMAVWAWNAAIASVCGDTVLWKPSEETPLTAIAVQKVANRVMSKHGLSGVFTLAAGTGETVGELLTNDRRASLVSFTGSTAVGRHVFRDRRAPLRRNDPRARWQQRDPRHRGRRPRDGDARHPLRRGRDRGSALHQHPAGHRPREHRRRAVHEAG